jgi:hypothetical protein
VPWACHQSTVADLTVEAPAPEHGALIAETLVGLIILWE